MDTDTPLAGDCRGQNFFVVDAGFQRLLGLYMADDLRDHLTPHLARLGELAGGELDDLARTADKHGPVLHPRDRFGRDAEWIEFHPAYREMERLAMAEFGMHAMAHRPGVLDWPEALPPLAKYAFQYLFTQAEFGLMCPISLADTATHVFLRYADDELRALYAPRLLSQDMGEVWRCAQFMTEKPAGSDVGRVETTAHFDAGADDGRGNKGAWLLTGEKWFCSNADADVAMVLARPDDAGPGTGGLGLFVLPKTLEDGCANAYRIVRLKDKLGTRSMASGEIKLEGAVAYPLGDLGRGFKQMLDQVNLSRHSHGVRAAAMMRRCFNEALAAARTREAFGGPIADLALVRRQLMKLLVPAEQALSMFCFTADAMRRAGDEGDGGGPWSNILRLSTPLIKFRACRDNIRVATGAMEMRGGNAYIEDYVEARLVRDAQIGVLWEGTSNIIGLDAIMRAVGKSGADADLADELRRRLDDASGLPGQFRSLLSGQLDRARAFARAAVESPERPLEVRTASGALYHATTAVLMAWEAAETGDGKRLLLSRLVAEHRLAARDPLATQAAAWEDAAASALLDDADLGLDAAAALLEETA